MPRIAALLTCYNRKATTLASLAQLFTQRLLTDAELAVFLVDDNSTDGTADAVRTHFPGVCLLRGNGDLFWCGGMRLAFETALKQDFDFYLWLNDDTVLNSDAIHRLLAAHRSISTEGYETAIVVASTRDPTTGAHTYGGVVRSSRVHPLKFRLLKPGDTPVQCDTMNGNCVLIPRAVATIAGNLSAEFPHGMADYDYGLRSRELGCTVWIAPGYLASCARNSQAGTFVDVSLPLRRRWQDVTSRKGLPPGMYWVFARRHGGRLWPIFWATPYLRVLLRTQPRRSS